MWITGSMIHVTVHYSHIRAVFAATLIPFCICLLALPSAAEFETLWAAFAAVPVLGLEPPAEKPLVVVLPDLAPEFEVDRRGQLIDEAGEQPPELLTDR